MLRSLCRLVRGAFVHVLGNKVILLVAVMAAAFEVASKRVAPVLETFNVGSAAEIVALPGKLWAVASPGLVGGLAAAAVLGAAASVLSMACLLATYSGEPWPLGAGLKSVASFNTLQFLVVEGLAGSAYLLIVYAAAWAVSALGLGGGVAGVAYVATIMSIAFPLFYMVASCGLFIASTDAPVAAKLSGARLFIRPENSRRLAVFYLLRIGVETGFAYLVVAASNIVGFPKVWAVFLATLIVALPLSVVQTAAVALKLEILRDAPWFGRRFAPHYRKAPSV